MAAHCTCPARARFSAPGLLLLAMGMLLPGALRGQGVVPYLELGAGRKQGDFGTTTQDTLWLGYLTGGVSSHRWDVNLTVPYLGLTRESGGISAQDQGLGDVLVRGAFRFLPETEDGWFLDGEGVIKLPTASEAKGLGTGRTDVGGFLSLHQRLGIFQWTVLGGWIQETATNQTGTDSNATSGAYVLSLRGAWYFDHDRWGASFEARGASFQGLPGAREISLDVFHPLTSTWGVKAVVTAGLTDGGPRQSVGVAIIHLFP